MSSFPLDVAYSSKQKQTNKQTTFIITSKQRILRVFIANEKKRRNCYIKLCIMITKMSKS